jgi:ubiquinone/menaquinone biosynthesis C-methylase UbiE
VNAERRTVNPERRSEHDVESHYNRVARHYDRRWTCYLSRTLTFLKSQLDLRAGMTILDVGCGTGQLEWLVLRERGNQRIVGVDVSEGMLEVARTKCQAFPNVSFRHADAMALPFTDQEFDIVVSASALHYFVQPEGSLVEMRRVVKSEGSVVILDWCRDYFSCRLLDGVLRLIEPGYVRCYAEDEFHRLLTNAGLEIRSASRVRFGAMWGLMIAKAKRSPSFS